MTATAGRTVPAALVLIAGLSGGVSAQKVPAGSGEQLAPHRAVYEITLADTRGGTGVTELTGRMVYELTGSTCQGYTQNMRFVTRMTNQEGADAVYLSVNTVKSHLRSVYRKLDVADRDAAVERAAELGLL